jgi:putative Holliday junction resolvase
MGRIVAIDFGLKRIGIAISDVSKKIAFPFKTVEGGPKAIENIMSSLEGKEIELFVFGLPIHLNGKESEMASIIRKFCLELTAKTNIAVQMIDERLSSKLADQALSHLKRKQRSERIDETAAAMMLQSYLNNYGYKPSY